MTPPVLYRLYLVRSGPSLAVPDAIEVATIHMQEFWWPDDAEAIEQIVTACENGLCRPSGTRRRTYIDAAACNCGA